MPATRLNPSFKIDGETVAVPKRSQKQRVASLERHRTDIIAAIDFLLSGV